jgi:hypothetical protein
MHGAPEWFFFLLLVIVWSPLWFPTLCGLLSWACVRKGHRFAGGVFAGLGVGMVGLFLLLVATQ